MVDAQCRLLLALSSARPWKTAWKLETRIGFLSLGLQDDCRTARLRIARKYPASSSFFFFSFLFVGLFGAIDLIDRGAQSHARGSKVVVWRANAGGRRRTQTARLRCCNAVMQCSTVQLQCVAGGQQKQGRARRGVRVRSCTEPSQGVGFFWNGNAGKGADGR